MPRSGLGGPEQRSERTRRIPRCIWLEELEDRTLLSTYRWTGASSPNWTDPGNWSLLSGAGTFPNAVGDIAQFTGTPTSQIAVVNQAITVGEIDFGTASNITIKALLRTRVTYSRCMMSNIFFMF